MYENIPSELKIVKNWVCWCGDKLPKTLILEGMHRATITDMGYFPRCLEAIGNTSLMSRIHVCSLLIRC